MRLLRCCVAALFVLSWTCLAPAQDRDELLASPTPEPDARQPLFVDLTPQEVRGRITMTSGRNYAVFGFNTPEIHVVLPDADNSVYAVVEFDPPTLVDGAGREVPFEIERGLYDHDTHHQEIRLIPIEGEVPVAYAHATGSVTVRYPTRIRTLAARPGEPVPEGLDVTFDGPFVIRRTPSDFEDPDAASFTGISPVRGYDASGAQLKAVSSMNVSFNGELKTETLAFWGEVAALQVDTIDEWTRIRITYDLPSVDPLPDSRIGMAPEDGDENPPTPDATVVAEVVEETPGDVIAAELGVTRSDATRYLRELGYPEPTGSLMVMSAVQGKTEDVKLFLAAGVPIDFADDQRTALVSAIMYRHLDLAEFLIEAGADVNLADSNNATPLFHAAGNCDATEVVRALLDAGADPSPATAGGMTALQMADVMSCTDNAAVIRAAQPD